MKREKRILIIAIFFFLFVIHYLLLLWNGYGFLMSFVALPYILFFMMGAGCFLRSIFLFLDRPILENVKKETMLKKNVRIAVWGTIEPARDPLLSPYSSRQCVLYEYQIYHRTVQKMRQGSDNISYNPEAVGWAFVPSFIKTGNDSINLSDYPKIMDFPEIQIEGRLGPLQQFIQQTKFIRLNKILFFWLPTLVACIPSISWLLFLKPPGELGEIKSDIDYSGKNGDFYADRIKERYVPLSSSVIAVGTYDSNLNALTPGWIGLRLICADSGLKEVIKSIRLSSIINIVGGIFLFVCWLFFLHMLEMGWLYYSVLRFIHILE